MTNIARNIKAQRKKLQISQEELAGKLYVTRQTVSNYENGKSNPDLETLQQLADILETDMDYLLYGEEKSKDKKAIRKNAVILGVCLLVIIAASVISYYERQSKTAFLMFPVFSWFMYVLGYPALMVAAGAGMTRLIMLITTSTPLRMRHKKVLHKSLIFSFIVYSIIMLPYAVTPIIAKIQIYLEKAANPYVYSHSFSFDMSLGVPFLSRIYLYHSILFDRYPALFALFFIIGCLLALTIPAKESKKLIPKKNNNS